MVQLRGVGAAGRAADVLAVALLGPLAAEVLGGGARLPLLLDGGQLS